MMITLPVDLVRKAAETALINAGVHRDHACLQVDLLVEAELRGLPSHGLLRLPRIVERIHNDVSDPLAQISCRWHGSAFLSVNGNGGLGPVIACAALEQLYERVGETGIAIASIARGNHLGMLAWYVEQCAARGFASIALTTSEALVHPWGGRRAMLGTNPIAIGVPATPRPFVLDMATGLISMGKIHDHADRGLPIPDNWALDENGNRTTDAQAAKRGAIAPFGDAKGYALCLAFELLVASVTGSALGRDVRGTLDSTFECNKGDLFIIMDVPSGSAMADTIGEFLNVLRASPAAEGFTSVAVPGDRSMAERERRLVAGLSLDDGLWRRLTDLAAPAAPQRESVGA